MAKLTADKIGQRAFDLGLLDERQLQDAWGALGSRDVSADEFLQILVRREYLTNYQVEHLMKGERTGLFFGDYKVLYLVGSGTFARVYRAVHRQTGEVVAIKALRTRYCENPAQYERFLQEGRLGCALRHPNIVPIYDVCSEKKNHFLVMEFVEGRSLREFVKIRGKCEPGEAIRLMSGITEGVRYAFENGLTHRDLKMSNVLVSSRGEAKLVDFGLAAMDENLSDADLMELPNVRTIDYAALERVTGVRKDDIRSDIFFLGCIFYNILTGVPPLSETRDRLQRLSKQRFTKVEPIRQLDPTLPDSVVMIVSKAMSLDPNQRYQSPAEILSDLTTAAKRLEGTPPTPNGKGAPSAASAQTDTQTPSVHHSVMIVESNVNMQDVFREGFKRAGYRVLLMSDPKRAVGRLQQDAMAANAVIFNAKQLGRAALDGFNVLGKTPKTLAIPAVLLLSASQCAWQEEADAAEHRIVLILPITMKTLREHLAKLIC